MYIDCLNNINKVRIKRKNKKKIENKKIEITRLSLFQYSKFRNSEISTVLHLVVPNLLPQPYYPISKKNTHLKLLYIFTYNYSS